MVKKTLSIQRTVYPLDYDRNNKAGYSEWMFYIHNEVKKDQSRQQRLHTLIAAAAVSTSYEISKAYNELIQVLHK